MNANKDSRSFAVEQPMTAGFKTTISLLLALPLLLLPGEKYDPSTLVFPPILHVWVQKATGTHLQIYTKNKVKVRDPQGVAATRLLSWEDTKRAEDDDELTVYGSNSGYDMIIYNTSKTSISFYGAQERNDQRLKQPHGVAADKRGNVYVADLGNNRVVHFFNPAQELRYVRPLTGFNAPRDVAISPNGRVYVADTGNNRVAVYQDDRQIASWDKAGMLKQPQGIAATDHTDEWSYFKDQFVVVSDSAGKRLQKFSDDGKLLVRRTAAEIGNPAATFGYLAIDYYSNIYATDMVNHCIHKFDRDLNYLTSFGRRGSGHKEFNEPRGIAIYKRFGQVIIAERESVQYYWIGTDVRDLKATKEGKASAVRVSYFLTEASFVNLEILDQQGKTVAEPMQKSLRLPGQQSELLSSDWTLLPEQDQGPNALSSDGNSFKPGRYKIRLTVKPTYSSYKHFEKKIETEFQL